MVSPSRQPALRWVAPKRPPISSQGGGVGATVDKGDVRLGHDQPEVVLEAVLEATPLVGDLVAAGRGVDPDVAAPHLERVAAHVVGEGVEGAARTELEAGVMPVADDDAVADGAARQRKAHVGATVVDGVDAALVGDQQHHAWALPAPS